MIKTKGKSTNLKLNHTIFVFHLMEQPYSLSHLHHYKCRHHPIIDICHYRHQLPFYKFIQAKLEQSWTREWRTNIYIYLPKYTKCILCCFVAKKIVANLCFFVVVKFPSLIMLDVRYHFMPPHHDSDCHVAFD